MPQNTSVHRVATQTSILALLMILPLKHAISGSSPISFDTLACAKEDASPQQNLKPITATTPLHDKALWEQQFREANNLLKDAKAMELKAEGAGPENFGVSKKEHKKLIEESLKLYSSAAKKLDLLRENAPDKEYEALVSIHSGTTYMRAKEYKNAIRVFDETFSRDDLTKDKRAQAMYWSAISNDRLKTKQATQRAKKLYDRLIREFPGTQWAKRVRTLQNIQR